MRVSILLLLLCACLPGFAQPQFQQPFRDCRVVGSTTIYDQHKRKWFFTDSIDAATPMLPASTFKVINLLIALETGVIRNESDTVRWVGSIDTTRYGYRPETYRDPSVEEAFRISAGWVFIELARKIGRARYQDYLARCGYGNGDLSERGDDFWNFGAFAITPRNQVEFLVKLYEGRLPFSRRNLDILKRVMITETEAGTVLRSKTGWTRVNGKDIGWWVGYQVRHGRAVFFATRITKERATPNPDFGACRKTITLQILRAVGALP